MPGYLRLILYSLLVIAFATACSSGDSPEEDLTAPAGFGFTVDPQTQSVTLLGGSVPGIAPQQTSDDPRLLTTDELELSEFSFAFLPGNILRIEARFLNITEGPGELRFIQPFTFNPAPGTENIISSTEPTISSDFLGGDGVLSPGEEIAQPRRFFPSLVFEVEHKNERFSYFVEAKAVVAKGNQTECAELDSAVAVPARSLARGIRRSLGLDTEVLITCADMRALESVEAQRIDNLEGLQFATNLKTLLLPFSDLTDLIPLAGFKKLQVLDLSYTSYTGTADLTALSGLVELRELGLEFSQNIASFEGLETLVNLERLDLVGLSDSENLAQEASYDLTPLATLTNLEELLLNFTLVDDLTPLADLTRLKVLGLSQQFAADGTGIISDLTPLDSLTKLEKLNLYNNQISDLTPLAKLTNLVSLQASRNLISDLTGLEALTKLEKLNLIVNPLTSIAPLVANPGLGDSNDDDIFIGPHCLDLSEGSDDQTAIQTIEARHPNPSNVEDYTRTYPEFDFNCP